MGIKERRSSSTSPTRCFQTMTVFCSLIVAQQLVENSVGIAYVCDLGCRWKLRFVSDASLEVTPALRKDEVTS
jgi:hypothetical protein